MDSNRAAEFQENPAAPLIRGWHVYSVTSSAAATLLPSSHTTANLDGFGGPAGRPWSSIGGRSGLCIADCLGAQRIMKKTRLTPRLLLNKDDQ
jgi:hypothetical protein